LKRSLFLVLLCLGLFQCAEAQIITYPAPKGCLLNTDFTVKVRQKGLEWQQVDTYIAQVLNVNGTKNVLQKTSFGYFDLNGEVEVSVTSNKGPVNEVRIRPLSKDIQPIIKDNTITFSFSGPHNLSVEVNGNIFQNLQLFANLIETMKPSPSDTNVIFYGPGIHQVGIVKLSSKKTVYIAGGAIVQGAFLMSNVKDVSILGRGILTQLPIQVKEGENMNPLRQNNAPGSRSDELTVEFSKNVQINGIIVLPNKYSALIGQSKNVSISNFKSFSAGGNADGIDVFCSSNVLIDNVFMRNADDCIAIYGHRWGYYGNTKKVTVQNSILWADVAHPILVGTHGDTANPDTLSDLNIKNVDILDQHENQIDYQGCLSLNAGDNNLIKDIRFENIRIEDIREGQLFNLRIMYNKKYNTSPGRGLENIYFKDISYNGNKANLSIISGYDETRLIKNITFENLRINGKVISDKMPDKPAWYKTADMTNIFIGEHVEDVKFIDSINPTPQDSVSIR
jgi:hypothetical protein